MLTTAAAVIAVLLLPLAAGADTARVVSVGRLSGASPFDGCGVPGEPTLSSEAEPHLAVDPRRPRRLVATWQQDRFAVDGGALSNLVAASNDGGRRWRTVRLPGLSRCTGGTDERASDPWLSVGPDGTVYQASLTFTAIPALEGLAGPTALRVSRSRDGGRTFSPPRQITAPKPATPDPPPLAEGTLPDPTLIEVLPDGDLVNVYVEANPTPLIGGSVPLRPWSVWARRSRDRGTTWSSLRRIAVIRRPGAPRDPESGAQLRAFNVASTAVARDGTVYVVCNDIRSPRRSLVLLSRSRDGGRRWSPPATVARVSTQAFLPAVAVMRDGTVGVTFDDLRRDRRGDGKLTTDVWLRWSRDRGRRWRERHLAGPFDTLTASRTGSTGITGRFLGDYQGLVALPDGFGALFAQARPKARAGPSDVFFARVQVR